MPNVTISATFTSRQEQTLQLTEQEWADLQSGKKKYHDFLDESDYDSGEWSDGFVVNQETMEAI